MGAGGGCERGCNCEREQRKGSACGERLDRWGGASGRMRAFPPRFCDQPGWIDAIWLVFAEMRSCKGVCNLVCSPPGNALVVRRMYIQNDARSSRTRRPHRRLAVQTQHSPLASASRQVHLRRPLPYLMAPF
eukprot:3776332-Rhodomonas_salina.2